jgi:hypothetical protein
MRDKTIKSDLLGNQGFKAIVQDLRGRVCPVCNHLLQTSLDYFSGWINRFSNDKEVQEEFADELGFCPFHTWQLASLASPQGIARGYPELLKRLSHELSDLAGAMMNAPDRVFALVKGSESCRVCSLWRDTEAAYVQRLSLFLQEVQGRRAYADSQGVCLRHLGLLMETEPPPDCRQFLLSEAARHFDQIARDLQNYSAKRNALRRDLIIQDEKDAVFRALTHIAGDRNGCPIF